MGTKGKKSSERSAAGAPESGARRGRLTSAERRQRILEAAVPLFTQEGFRGVTTKSLAQRAGVSEALLYQHFPSKEVLYEQVQDFCCQPNSGLREVLGNLCPSTEALVQILFFLTKIVVEKAPLGDEVEPVFPRLMLHSMLDDGMFARLFLERTVARVPQIMQKSFAAARAAGDLVADAMPDDLRFWFCHHLLVTVSMCHLPPIPVVPYRLSPPELMSQMMQYMMRGIGLTAAAEARYYDYVTLNATASAWLASRSKGPS